MIHAVLPAGSYHGWGICGKYIVREMSKFTDITLMTEQFDFNEIGDEFDFRLLNDKRMADGDYEAIKKSPSWNVNAPVLQAIIGNSMRPLLPQFRGNVNVGYTFFEDNVLPQQYLEDGRNFFDTVVTGSSWCEEVLRGYGLTNVTTIIQGIDPTIFNPFFPEKEYFRDRFVVFSGGKFELRKGQDLVIKAYKAFQDRHRDVMLINSWFNKWNFSLQTMAASPYITFAPASDDYISMMNGILRDNGLDMDRVITLPPYPNVMMAKIYRNSDVGLFPNRCEGGTNLVLMEYMACGKPAVASFSSGHRDILTERNSIRLTDLKQTSITNNNVAIAVWDEPNPDEILAALEAAYRNRERLAETGRQAGEDLAALTWTSTTRRFYEVLTR
jgi:glycosyltransferase involved in cell wall biosynthesis